MRARSRLLGIAFLLVSLCAGAQQNLPANGLLLVAKPGMADPTFARSVVLVSQTEDGSTVGVILNRPTTLQLSQFLSGEFKTDNYREPIYYGGPVMSQALVMVFRAQAVPEAAAFHVLKNVYLTMHPDNVARMLADPAAQYRVYAGFSGWQPRQLQSEVMRDGWYFLQADEATLFRKSADGMWEELLERAKKSDSRGRS